MKKIFLFWVILYGAVSLLQAQGLRLMSYNIKYDNPNDSTNSWDARKEALAEMLAFYNPGITGMQEVEHHQLQYLQSRFGAWRSVGVARDDGKTAGE